MKAPQTKQEAMEIEMKTYLCVEHGEEFTVQARDLAHAQELAAIYGGRVVKELK